MAHIINYKPIEEGKRYHVYADLLFSEKNNLWRFSFEAFYDCHSYIIIDADLTKSGDIQVIKNYIDALGINANDMWWRTSCANNYYLLERIKKDYGDWKSFKYLNTLTF